MRALTPLRWLSRVSAAFLALASTAAADLSIEVPNGGSGDGGVFDRIYQPQ
jgi:hypothetical protein